MLTATVSWQDKESTRSKFCLVTWIGSGTKVMRKAKVTYRYRHRMVPVLIEESNTQVSVQTADVKQVLRTFSIDVAAREVDDLNEGPIVIRLRKVSFNRRAFCIALHLEHSYYRLVVQAMTAYKTIEALCIIGYIPTLGVTSRIPGPCFPRCILGLSLTIALDAVRDMGDSVCSMRVSILQMQVGAEIPPSSGPRRFFDCTGLLNCLSFCAASWSSNGLPERHPGPRRAWRRRVDRFLVIASSSAMLSNPSASSSPGAIPTRSADTTASVMSTAFCFEA